MLHPENPLQVPMPIYIIYIYIYHIYIYIIYINTSSINRPNFYNYLNIIFIALNSKIIYFAKLSLIRMSNYLSHIHLKILSRYATYHWVTFK